MKTMITISKEEFIDFVYKRFTESLNELASQAVRGMDGYTKEDKQDFFSPILDQCNRLIARINSNPHSKYRII